MVVPPFHTPSFDHFSRKPHGFLGTTILGNPHMFHLGERIIIFKSAGDDRFQEGS